VGAKSQPLEKEEEFNEYNMVSSNKASTQEGEN
jgi:hypothetical protein